MTRIGTLVICLLAQALSASGVRFLNENNKLGGSVLVQLLSVPELELPKGSSANQSLDRFLYTSLVYSKYSANHHSTLSPLRGSIETDTFIIPSFGPEYHQVNVDVKTMVETALSCEITVLDTSMGLLQFCFFDLDKRNDFIIGLKILLNQNWQLKFQCGSDVSRRQRVPNDPEFNQQKYLPLIQMPDAWEYGISTINRIGDTAVIAIIDDGVDTGHADLFVNLYRNNREIPWNGIDEDSNGYVDDYWGWNGGDNSPLIFNRESTRFGHGTSVASVMMASGNNNKGITGMLWDTKLLITHCYPTGNGSADVGVVNCMVYLYKQKKRYLQSKGKLGINIVAVNMSVGIDKAFPFEFPIWCAMYDSLVSVGILCASSTTNLDIDVDDPTEGDIPSLCPSNGLIVVSSADENKNRTKSGYGAKSVDIYATGQNMYLAKPNQTHSYPYAMESGTSFASPQVTATIAWLYSRSCHTYLNLWRNNPDSAVLLMRKWILSSTQQNSTLMGKSTSGGYLQVLSAWEKMHQWCSANDNAYSTKTVQPNTLALYPNPIASDRMVLDGVRISNPNLHTRTGTHARLLNVAGNVVSELTIDNYNFGEDTWMVIKSETVLAPGYYQITLSNSQTQVYYSVPIVVLDN